MGIGENEEQNNENEKGNDDEKITFLSGHEIASGNLRSAMLNVIHTFEWSGKKPKQIKNLKKIK